MAGALHWSDQLWITVTSPVVLCSKLDPFLTAMVYCTSQTGSGVYGENSWCTTKALLVCLLSFLPSWMALPLDKIYHTVKLQHLAFFHKVGSLPLEAHNFPLLWFSLTHNSQSPIAPHFHSIVSLIIARGSFELRPAGWEARHATISVNH